MIVTTALTMAEVAMLPASGLLPEEEEQRIVDFFENDYIVVRPIDRFVAEKAREIIRNHRPMRAADAIQVAVALLSRVREMHTYDGRLLSKDGLMGIPPLRINEPRWDHQWALPLKQEGPEEG